MTGQDLGRRRRHDRGRERRTGHPHVAGLEHAIRHRRRDQGTRGHRSHHVAAGSRHVRLVEAVHRHTVGRPRGDRVVARIRRHVLVERTDRDHERVVAGCVRHAHRAALAVVARGRDDHDALQPESLNRLVERVDAEARLRRTGQREVDDTNAVLARVLVDPVGRCDHVARARLTVGVGRPDRHDLRVRCTAGVLAGARSDAGHHRAVTFLVVAISGSAERAQVDLRDQPAAEVTPRLDAGVHNRDRRRLRSRAGDGARVRVEAVLQDRHVRRVLPHRRVLVGRRLHLHVRRDRRHVGVLGQLDEVGAGQRGADAGDRDELLLDVTLAVLDFVAGRLGVLVALDDDVELLKRVRSRLSQEAGRNDRRFTGDSGSGAARHRDYQHCCQRRQDDATLSAPPESVRPGLTAPSPQRVPANVPSESSILPHSSTPFLPAQSARAAVEGQLG